MVPFDRWVHQERGAGDRLLGLESVAQALSRLERCGAILPELDSSDVFLQEAGGGCGSAPGVEAVTDAPVRRLPGVAFANLRGGQIAPGTDPTRARAALRHLRTELKALVSADERDLLALG